MQLAALVVASDIKLHLGYISSERNPADWPSRGRRYGKVVKHGLKVEARSRETRTERLLSSRRSSWRYLRRCGAVLYSSEGDTVSYASSSMGSRLAQPDL